jgi:hypothetical protein
MKVKKCSEPTAAAKKCSLQIYRLYVIFTDVAFSVDKCVGVAEQADAHV